MRAGAKRRNHWLRRHAGAWLAGGLAVGLLSGCTVFAEEEPAPATIQAETDDDAFPAVGSVPDAAPETTTAAEREVIIENLEADRTSATDPDGYAFTTIQTPPPSSAPTAMSTTTMSTTSSVGSGTTTFPIAPATPLPAPQLLPTQAYAGPQLSPGGQVMVDYSAIGGYPGAGVVPGGSYAQTGYYGGVYGGGQAGQPVALVYFQNGSAALSTSDRNIINDVARLQKAQGGLIRVVGHASLATGNVDPANHDRINYEMSLARANAVAQALMRAGVPSNQLQVAAVGSSDPEYYEFTPTGEAGNRRAEIYLVY